MIKLLLATLSGIFYFLVLPEHSYALLALITYLPLLKALEGTTLKQTYGLSLLAGMVMTALCTPWMADVGQTFFNIPHPYNLLLVLEMAIIGAQPIAISMTLYRYLANKLPQLKVWLLPLSVIVIFSFFSPLLKSLLSYGFIEYNSIIQTVDITGVLGLEFIIITCNALLYQLFVSNQNSLKSMSIYLSLTMIILWLSYSHWRFNTLTAQLFNMETMSFSLMQPNRKPSLDAKNTNKIAQDDLWEFSQYQALDNHSIELAIWPEGTYYGFVYDQQSTNNIKKLVKETQIPLLFQDDYFSTNKAVIENRVYFLTHQNQLKQQYYSKRELMPFGEKIDLLGYERLLAAIKIEKVPYQAGTQPAYFALNGKFLVPLVCFEVLKSELVAKSLNTTHSYKVAVVLSQDGWYGDSIQQVSAHRAITQFRAIENRTPFIHVINNGPSQVINIVGENSFNAPHLTRGSWQSSVSVPKNINSFFKQYPTWFEILLQLILASTIVLAHIKKTNTR